MPRPRVDTTARNPPKPVQPRVGCEVIVKGITDNLISGRSPKDTVRYLKSLCPSIGAVAARKLPSLDIVLTFSSPGLAKLAYFNLGWVRATFGPGARLSCTTYTVITKGVC